MRSRIPCVLIQPVLGPSGFAYVNGDEPYIKLHEGRRPEELPPNYAILDMMESNETNSNGNNSVCEASTSADSYFNYDHPEKNPNSSSNSSAGESEPGNSEGNPASNTWKWIGLGIAASTVGVLAGVGFKGIKEAAGSLKEGCLSLAAAAAAVIGAPVLLLSQGLTSAGITTGSSAASMMSSAAIASGGGVAAGSTVAVLQSAGAAGIGSAATAILGATAAAIGSAATAILGATAAAIGSAPTAILGATAAAIGAVFIAALGATAFSNKFTRAKDDVNDSPGNADNTCDDDPREFERDVENNYANIKKHDNKEGSNNDADNGSDKSGEEEDRGTGNKDSSKSVVGRGHRRILYLHEI